MIAHRTLHSRLKFGKSREAAIARLLISRFGFRVEEVTPHADIEKKVDRNRVGSIKLDGVCISQDGLRQSVQIKYRESGRDIIVDVYEPFHGEESPETKKGRDYASQCDHYAVQTGEFIHVIRGQSIRNAIDATLKSWRDAGSPVRIGKQWSAKGINLLITEDHHSKLPKMIMFIPVDRLPQDSVVTKPVKPPVTEMASMLASKWRAA